MHLRLQKVLHSEPGTCAQVPSSIASTRSIPGKCSYFSLPRRWQSPKADVRVCSLLPSEVLDTIILISMTL